MLNYKLHSPYSTFDGCKTCFCVVSIRNIYFHLNSETNFESFCTTVVCFLIDRYGLILPQKKGLSKTSVLQKPSVFGDDSDEEVIHSLRSQQIY